MHEEDRVQGINQFRMWRGWVLPPIREKRSIIPSNEEVVARVWNYALASASQGKVYEGAKTGKEHCSQSQLLLPAAADSQALHVRATSGRLNHTRPPTCIHPRLFHLPKLQLLLLLKYMLTWMLPVANTTTALWWLLVVV
jgi:hypothetical protein